MSCSGFEVYVAITQIIRENIPRSEPGSTFVNSKALFILRYLCKCYSFLRNSLAHQYRFKNQTFEPFLALLPIQNVIINKLNTWVNIMKTKYPTFLPIVAKNFAILVAIYRQCHGYSPFYNALYRINNRVPYVT